MEWEHSLPSKDTRLTTETEPGKRNMRHTTGILFTGVDDYRWTTGGDSSLMHVRKIDAGASGEVHEVISLSTNLTIQIRDEVNDKVDHLLGNKDSLTII